MYGKLYFGKFSSLSYQSLQNIEGPHQTLHQFADMKKDTFKFIKQLFQR